MHKFSNTMNEHGWTRCKRDVAPQLKTRHNLAGKLFVGSEFTSASARVAPYAVNPLAVGGGRRLKGGMENAH